MIGDATSSTTVSNKNRCPSGATTKCVSETSCNAPIARGDNGDETASAEFAAGG